MIDPRPFQLCSHPSCAAETRADGALCRFYKALAGIHTVLHHPGYVEVVIAPPDPASIRAVSNLSAVAATVSTQHGELSVSWRITTDTGTDATPSMEVNVTVPFGCSATVKAPDPAAAGQASARPACTVQRIGTGAAEQPRHPRAGRGPAGAGKVVAALRAGSGQHTFSLTCATH